MSKKMTDASKEMRKKLQMEIKNLKIFFENVSGKHVQIQFFSVEFCLVTHLQHLKSFVGQ